MTARSMTRRQYHQQRRLAFRAERNAALLVGTSHQAAELQMAKSLRAELAPPSDPTETQRAVRWACLGVALRVSHRATVLRLQARRIAVEGCMPSLSNLN